MKLNSELEEFEKRFQDKIMSLEKTIGTLQREINSIKKENETLKNCLISGKNKNVNRDIEKNDRLESEKADDIIEATGIVEKENVCGKCGFVGKTEAGLKNHDTAKHKVSLMKLYRRV